MLNYRFKKRLLILSIFIFIAGTVHASTFVDGGNRLVNTQMTDGSWEWNLGSGVSSTNQAAPAGMGLLAAYNQTGDINYLNQAIAAGEFIIANSPTHHTQNGIFMSELSRVTGDNRYADTVKSDYYDALEAGTFEKGGLFYDTATYAQYILNLRIDQEYDNLALWDLGTAAYGAELIGASESELVTWGNYIETGLNAWHSAYSSTGNNYAVLGLAGSILGLAALNQDLDNPISGGDYLDGAMTAGDLADILITYQAPSGGFSKYPDYPLDAYAGAQATAFSIIALIEIDAELYDTQINKASSWLQSIQLQTGGWSDGWAGIGTERNEVTGEVLWSMNAAVPEPSTMILLGFGLLSIASIGRKKLHTL